MHRLFRILNLIFLTAPDFLLGASSPGIVSRSRFQFNEIPMLRCLTQA